MEPLGLRRAYLDLTTPHVADAMLRLDIPIRQAPASVGPLSEGTHLVGRARPARHAGSVDVFLKAFERAEPGDVSSSTTQVGMTRRASETSSPSKPNMQDSPGS